MDRLILKAKKECKYKENDRRLKQQVINSTNYGALDSSNNWSLLKLQTLPKSKMNKFTYRLWGSQTVMLRSMKDTTEFEAIKRQSIKCKSKIENATDRSYKKYQVIKCKSCRMVHLPGKCPVYGKSCRGCRKLNYFHGVCRRIQRPDKEISKKTGQCTRYSRIQIQPGISLLTEEYKKRRSNNCKAT